jgi:hypothetical protein
MCCPFYWLPRCSDGSAIISRQTTLEYRWTDGNKASATGILLLVGQALTPLETK